MKVIDINHRASENRLLFVTIQTEIYRDILKENTNIILNRFIEFDYAEIYECVKKGKIIKYTDNLGKFISGIYWDYERDEITITCFDKRFKDIIDKVVSKYEDKIDFYRIWY